MGMPTTAGGEALHCETAEEEGEEEKEERVGVTTRSQAQESIAV